MKIRGGYCVSRRHVSGGSEVLFTYASLSLNIHFALAFLTTY